MGSRLAVSALVFLVALSGQTHPRADPEGSPRTSIVPEMCSPGHRLTRGCTGVSAQCRCVPCAEGTFQARSTLEGKCDICSPCQEKLGQRVVRPCSATRDAECGCHPGHYKVGDDTLPGGQRFSCKACTHCRSLHRHTARNCSEEADAACGVCRPGFCSSGGEACQACPTRTPKPSVNPTLGPRRQPVELGICGKECKSVVIPLGLLLFVVAVVSLAFFCKQRRWTRSLLPSDVESRMLPAQTSSAGPGVAEVGPPHVGPPLFLQGRSLYAVLEAVPARRWKEFMRGLGLRDGEIERVELEHPQLREQQYQMLRCWAQQRPGAAPQDLFAALEDMQLEGCAQALREALQGQ